MRCEIRTGGDGVPCWNSVAIQSFVDETTRREAGLAERNPDLAVVSGCISCYGCEVQEYDYGTKCTAKITKTLYSVPGEVQPRPADAVGWHREIPGLLTIRPESAIDTAAQEPSTRAVTAAHPVAPAPAPTVPKTTRRRGLFSR